ncbi:MAG: translation initiation factor IF-2 [bacterium]|nr:translation initiation factor IF-2 [bacterium]
MPSRGHVFFIINLPNNNKNVRILSQTMTDKRSPVVVVMGHVDHGKTTLLDYIRKTSIAAREAGGITQSIGAYEIEHRGKKITFIDTPGHEAFSQMRTRGTKAADIAILVVAADDGVKPQTREAINIAKEAGIPFVIAINKIDRPNADVEKTKNDLMNEGVLLEGYGGNISHKLISAKTGDGINELLDLILLVAEAEVEDLSYDSKAPGEGFILESKMDNRQGITVSAIIENGTLKTGDEIAAGSAGGKIKILKDFVGRKIDKAMPSSPVLILGFEKLPAIGEKLTSGEAIALTTELKSISNESQPPITENENRSIINLIIKGDVSGSVEALVDVIKNLPTSENVALRIIDSSVGEISDGDVKSAAASKAIIIGFRVKINKAAEGLSKAQSVKIMSSEIIYELIQAIEKEMMILQRGHIKGDLQILAVFGKKGADKQIVGGKVISGKIENNGTAEIERQQKTIGQGKIINLQQGRKDAIEVIANNEAGLLIDADAEIKVGDHLIIR